MGPACEIFPQTFNPPCCSSMQCNSSIWVHASRYIYRSLSCRIRISCYVFPLNGETKDPKCFPSPSPSFSALRKIRIAPLPCNTSCWKMQWTLHCALFTLSSWAPHTEGWEACALGASSLIKQLVKQSATTGEALCLALIKVLWDHLFKTSNLRFGYQILLNRQQSSKAL